MTRFDIVIHSWNDPVKLKRKIGSLIEVGALEKCERLIVIDSHSINEDTKSFLLDLTQFDKLFLLHAPRFESETAVLNNAFGLSRAPKVLYLTEALCEDYLQEIEELRMNVGVIREDYGYIFCKQMMAHVGLFNEIETLDDYLEKLEEQGIMVDNKIV